MTQDVLLHLLTECFETLGGVPSVILSDNMKTVMDEARTTYKKGKINIKFDAFKKDFGFELLPCRASTPETKGKVESQMKYLEVIRAYSGKLNLIELFTSDGKNAFVVDSPTDVAISTACSCFGSKNIERENKL